MLTPLETDRLVLRAPREDDADDLFALNDDPDVMRYLNGGKPASRAEIVEEVLPRLMSYADRADGYGFWIAQEKAGGAFVGWFHLRPAPQDGVPDEPEVGYRLRKACWGRGYATEGSLALIDLAFTSLGARRVFAQTMTVNAGSRRVMEKCGLRFVRTFFPDWPEQIDGSELGEVEYELLRADWAG